MANHNKRTKYEEELIKNKTHTAKELSVLLNRNQHTIYQWCKELNIKLTKHKEKKGYENFFTTWSNEMAYVLGFIAADGCIMFGKRNSGVIEITLAEKDKPHLEKIRKILNVPQKIYYKKTNYGTDACRLTIGCLKMAKDINEIGITPKKSLTMKWPNIPEEYIPHFIRGYIDGDGCIEIIQSKTSSNLNLRCSILGTKEFLNHIKEYFSKIYGDEIGSLYASGNYYVLSYSGINSSLKFCDWIYSNSTDTTRLERKYKTYKKFKVN